MPSKVQTTFDATENQLNFQMKLWEWHKCVNDSLCWWGFAAFLCEKHELIVDFHCFHVFHTFYIRKKKLKVITECLHNIRTLCFLKQAISLAFLVKTYRCYFAVYGTTATSAQVTKYHFIHIFCLMLSSRDVPFISVENFLFFFILLLKML